MSNLAFVLVLCSAVSHALWNFYAKKSLANSIALIWAAQLLAGLVLLPLTIYLFCTQGIGASGLGFILVSSFAHATYIWLLGSTYELGEISVVYPIARGTGIAGTVLVATLFGIDSLTLLGFLGAACIY